MSVETNAVVTLPVDLFVYGLRLRVCWCCTCLRDYVLYVCVGILYVCVLVSQGLFLLLLALGGAVCDVVEAGSDPC